jgi:hypothetical protein
MNPNSTNKYIRHKHTVIHKEYIYKVAISGLKILH